jgi:branched-chain amino acid transport system substrate-binding protein
MQSLRQVKSALLPLLLFGLLLAAVPASSQTGQPLRLYIDADRTHSTASAKAIEQGVRTALSEVGNRLNGRPVELVIRDHRTNAVRSLQHLEEFLADKNAMALFSGMHSPPLLENREFINQNRILVLNPWAAAGPITRPADGPNWIFRLSVDDTKAGEVIAEHAHREGFEFPFLLLEETGWGRSNHHTMTAAVNALGMEVAGTEWFHWGTTPIEMELALGKALTSGADVIFLVANAPEGEAILRAMHSLFEGQRLPIRSHWGITGADFVASVGMETLKEVDLSFIQTRFSFINHGDRASARRVLKWAGALYPEIRGPRDITAPAGFIHAYDLTRLLIAAAEQAGTAGSIQEVRQGIHQALENLDRPVTGLIKIYERPFSPYSPATPDAHEALLKEDLMMAVFGPDGEIRLLEKP